MDGRHDGQDMTALDKVGPLLETKLYVPRPRRELVSRPRLSERLGRGSASKLTLISAPAGFGKTMLLAEWLAAVPAGRPPVAWLSLDQADNQPMSFWPYLVSALQVIAPGVGEAAIALLRAPQPAPIETVLATLLNELGGLPSDVVLVLDDYHVIDAPDIHGGMAFLLDHLPRQVHLVIATRSDPALPLARLRARGELVEIRAADLRFTPDEAAAYLNGVMGLGLTGPDVTALEGRTEGWIAALQLAALSIQGRDDVAGFIAGFAGDDRYIVDYLVEEVLHRQPEDVRTFLLQTSILGRMSGPLCDAVTGQDGGKAMLDALDRGNLFLVPLDDRRRWYRYHHLFADVLQAHLLDEQPGVVPLLQQRASIWFEQNGDAPEAVRHALAAADYSRAADLIERAGAGLRSTRQEALLLTWLRALPDKVIAFRPVLSVDYAGALLSLGQLEGAESRLQDAERWLDTTVDGRPRPTAELSERIVVDAQDFKRLPSAIATYRAAQALAMGDVAGTIRHAQRGLELAGSDDPLTRGSAAGLLALAAWSTGDLADAHRSWTECDANLQKAGHIADVTGPAMAMADIRVSQGRLHDAMRTYERGLRLLAEPGRPVLRGAADMHVGMSVLLIEHDEVDAARRELEISRDLGEHLGLAQNPYRWHAAMAQIRISEGDLGGALAEVDEAGRLYVGDFFPNVRPIAALRARLLVAQGRVAEAGAWAREQGLSADDAPTYLREYEHITLARILLGRTGNSQLLERLLDAALAGERAGSAIEILLLQALALRAAGDIPAALVPLEHALTLAEPEGYVRMFVNEGAPLATLLQAALKRGVAPAYVRALLTAFGPGQHPRPLDQALVEPLSERELDVLRLLGTDLDGPDIARELVVSLHTVRSHTKSIYAKLGVNNRRAAVSRAAELGLLGRTRNP
jgi:LuxR family transcriptional regulator, maltose regulon positive regulatory protein